MPKPLVAASVGPYGAFLADGSEYRGYPDVQTEYLEVFHIPRLALFAEENPDILSFETIPSYDEAIAIARAIHIHQEGFLDGLHSLVKMATMFLVVKLSSNVLK